MDMDSRPGSPPNSPYTTVDNNSCKYDLLDIEHLRRDISFLPQNSFILSGTVLENISYGITNMPMEQILYASCPKDTKPKWEKTACCFPADRDKRYP